MATWTVDQIFQYSKFLINKAQMQTYEPNDFFYAWNSEQRSLMSDLTGKWQARSSGKGGANTGLIENEVILTALAPFTKGASLSVSSGAATRPEDHIYTLAIRVNDSECYHVNKGQIYSILDSVIDPPSVANNTYYFTDYETTIKVYPSTVTSIDIDYIRDCRDVVWGFTIDGDGLPVYDAGTSVQPEWKNPEIIEITRRTLKGLGVHFSSQDFENFGQATMITGD